MNLTLGVHGPKFLHAILFDDENDAGGLGFEAESEFDSLRFDNQFGFEEA
jgi:hypothetical protein